MDKILHWKETLMNKIFDKSMSSPILLRNFFKVTCLTWICDELGPWTKFTFAVTISTTGCISIYYLPLWNFLQDFLPFRKKISPFLDNFNIKIIERLLWSCLWIDYVYFQTPSMNFQFSIHLSYLSIAASRPGEFRGKISCML